jgi:hypothetical protein
MFFLAKQHQAMLILQGILFWTFTLVLIGNFLKLTKTVFLPKFWSLLICLCILTVNFYLFLVRQLFCKGDSTAPTSKAILWTTFENLWKTGHFFHHGAFLCLILLCSGRWTSGSERTFDNLLTYWDGWTCWPDDHWWNQCSCKSWHLTHFYNTIIQFLWLGPMAKIAC